LRKEILSESCSTMFVAPGTATSGPTFTRSCRYEEIGPVTVPSIGVEGGF